MEQTYQVAASATKPQSVRPPFPAHGLTATNNATVLVTITSDQGDTFALTPGQSKTQGYRGSPGQWTVTAKSDGPGSVALSFTDQFTAGDATPDNVAQSQGTGNRQVTIGNGTGQLSAVQWDTSGAQEAIVTADTSSAGIGSAKSLELAFSVYLNGVQIYVGSAYPPITAIPVIGGHWSVRFGRGARYPIGDALRVEGFTGLLSWGVPLYLNLFGG